MGDQNTVAPGPDVPVSTIIIVACVCGFIVLVLLGILIFLCIRKRKTAAKNSNYTNKHKPTHIHSNGSVDKGIVNPAADDIDLDDPTMGGRYAEQRPYDVYYDNHKMKAQLNGYPAERPPPYNGYSQNEYNEKNIDMPDNDIYNHKNRRKPPTDMLYLDDPDNLSHNMSRSSHGNDPPESGYSTPDPTKPKKIIYEVVV